MTGGPCLFASGWCYVAYLLTQSREKLRTSWGPKCERYTNVDDGNFTTGMENRETHYSGRETCRIPRVVCASLLTCQRTHQRRPLRRDVTVWTVPLTWSESPLIIRPFAKFSLRTPFQRFQLFLSFLVLT